MNKEQVFELMNDIQRVYPNFDFDQEKLNTWHRLLKDQDSNVVFGKADKYAKENKYPPTISDLRENKTILPPDPRDMDIEFHKWVGNGGLAEHFDWATGKGFNLEEE